MAYRGKTGVFFRPTPSMERLDRKVSVLGTDAFRKIAALEHQIGDLNGFMETMKYHMLEMQQTLVLKDVQQPRASTQILDSPPSPKRAASATERKTIASRASRKAQKVRKGSSQPPQSSHRMVLRSRSKRDT
ncbi:MAG: hypothetical protein Q9188_001373 [Gyalolechia gomerana]